MGHWTLSKVLVGGNGERIELGRVNLSEGDISILVDLIRHGDNTPKNIAENTGQTRQNVSQRIKELKKSGFVVNKGGGVWTLTPEGVELARALRGSHDLLGDDNN